MALRCGSVSGPAPVKNIVMFDRTGAPVDPTGNICAPNVYPCNGSYSSLRDFPRLDFSHYKDYTDAILDGIDHHPPDATTGKKRILLFIHGGLNTQLSTIDRSVTTVGPIANESSFYPVFVNWQSSLLSSYGNHLIFIRQGRDWRWKPFAWLLVPVYLSADLARAITRSPAVDAFMFRSDWQSTKAGKAAQTKVFPLTSEQFINGDDARTKWEQRKYFLAYMLTLPVKVLGAPVIDGFGTSAWNGMERASETIFRNDEGTFSEDGVPALLPNVEGPPQAGTNGGLDVFLRRLLRYMREHGGYEKFEVVLVGHSMGTIVLNEMLRSYPELPVSNIVYMAAACSIRDYEESALTFMTRPEHQTTQLYHLVLHYAAELRDRETVGFSGNLDLPPRGSLLVWIDNYLSTPRYYRDLTAGRIVNLVASLDDLDQYSAQLLARVHIREFSVGGDYWKTDPQHHGDFSKLAFWLDDCWKPHPNRSDRCYPR